MTRVVLTAGYDRAAHVIALATLLERDGVTVAGVLVTRALTPARLRAYLRQRDAGFVAGAARRFFGRAGAPAGASPLRDYLAANAIADRSLRRWCRRRGVAYRVVASLAGGRAAAFVRAAEPDGVLYGGGGILREPFIAAAAGRVLNAHHGPLPAVRGMNACEWSLLFGLPLTVSVHYIDAGIDTGPVVASIPVAPAADASLAAARERCAVAAIEGLRRHVGALHEPLPPPDPRRDAYKQCYVLAPALREILAARLRSRARAG